MQIQDPLHILLVFDWIARTLQIVPLISKRQCVRALFDYARAPAGYRVDEGAEVPLESEWKLLQQMYRPDGPNSFFLLHDIQRWMQEGLEFPLAFGSENDFDELRTFLGPEVSRFLKTCPEDFGPDGRLRVAGHAGGGGVRVEHAR